MNPAEHAALVEHYARLLFAWESTRDVAIEGGRRADHWIHTRVRKSRANVTSRQFANRTENEIIPGLLSEAVERGVQESELRRWIMVIRWERDEIKVPPTLTEIVLNSPPGS